MSAPASGRLNLASERLLAKQPFYHSILSRLAPRPNEHVETLGVACSTGATIELHYNPAFVLSITLDELVAVLIHEVLHIVFGHLEHDPAQFPDRWALTVAEEITVNEFIVEPLPGTPVLLAQFPDLPAGESTGERYRRLAAGNGCGLNLPCAPPALPASLTVDDHELWTTTTGRVAAVAVTSLLEEVISEQPSDPATVAALELIAKHGTGLSRAVARDFLSAETAAVDWGAALRRSDDAGR